MRSFGRLPTIQFVLRKCIWPDPDPDPDPRAAIATAKDDLLPCTFVAHPAGERPVSGAAEARIPFVPPSPAFHSYRQVPPAGPRGFSPAARTAQMRPLCRGGRREGAMSLCRIGCATRCDSRAGGAGGGDATAAAAAGVGGPHPDSHSLDEPRSQPHPVRAGRSRSGICRPRPCIRRQQRGTAACAVARGRRRADARRDCRCGPWECR